MQSIRHTTIRVALRSKVALTVPRAVRTPRFSTPNPTSAAAVTGSRPFVTTRCLANDTDFTCKEANAGLEGSTSIPDSGAVAPEQITSKVKYAKGQDTPYALFVRNIVFDANEEHLVDAFQKYGEITKASLARDARGLSRGYAFIFFTSAEAVNKAAAGANGSFWHGRRIHASPRLEVKGAGKPRPDRPDVPLSERTPTNALYIGNIPYETTDAELNKIFRGLENVTDVRIAVDRSTGWPRGFAHADFSTPEAAMEAAQKLESMTLLGRQLRVDFSQPARTGSRLRRGSSAGEESQMSTIGTDQ